MSSAYDEYGKCMVCKQKKDLVWCSDLIEFQLCKHVVCKSCFRQKNCHLKSQSYICSVCKGPYYSVSSMSEALAVGEGAYLYLIASKQVNTVEKNKNNITDYIKYPSLQAAISYFENATANHSASISALLFLISCYKLLISCLPDGLRTETAIECTKLYKCCLQLIDMNQPDDSSQLKQGLHYYYSLIGGMFLMNGNYYAAAKYQKLAYGMCLRSEDHTNLSKYKASLINAKELVDMSPSLRFAIGAEVECLCSKTGEWMRGEVVEERYREPDFPLKYCAPYRVRVLETVDVDDWSDDGERKQESDSEVKPPRTTTEPDHIIVEDDSDRLIRRPGVLSIEETRYEALLERKLEELSYVYCSKEFIQGVYDVLKADEIFCAKLLSMYRIELTVDLLYRYRMLAMYRRHLRRTESGYALPTQEQVIEDMRVFFVIDRDPPALESDATILRNADLLIMMASCINHHSDFCSKSLELYRKLQSYESHLARAFLFYAELWLSSGPFTGSFFKDMSAPILSVYLAPGLTTDINQAKSPHDMYRACIEGQVESSCTVILKSLWMSILTVIAPGGERGIGLYEYPLVFYFVKYSLEQGMGVPAAALGAYNDIKHQLCCSFIRCGNTACKKNKLDMTDRSVRFKRCARCQSVIYCCRDCQLAHYPVHKELCRAASLSPPFTEL